MDFKRHPNQNQVQMFNFGSRTSNTGNLSYGGHGGYPNFGNHHPRPPQQHGGGVRGYKADYAPGRLSMTQIFRNLMKSHQDNINEREGTFRQMFHYRDNLMKGISIILTRGALNDEELEKLFQEVQITSLPSNIGVHGGEEKDKQNQSSLAVSSETDQALPVKKGSEKIERAIINQLKSMRQETINQIMEELRVCHAREQAYFEGGCGTHERRLDKELMEFFTDVERQIMDYEKQVRSDNYAQLLSRLRNADREISIRDQKIVQLEESLKIVSDRSEKLMAELQQVNADHQFEKLQLYHQVEVCKVNAKCLAMDELSRLFKWKSCACGRNYDNDLLREIDIHFNNNGFGCSYQQEQFGRCLLPPNMTERKEMPMGMPGPGSWSLPLPTSSSSTTLQTLLPPAPPSFPTGSFTPAEEAATKGVVMNDLKDRYDELQLKAAGIPNYEDVRTMILKIVCHFKLGDFRVMEEMGGKKFVSTLFYCTSDELVPTTSNNIFSIGYGETPEEATAKSVKKAYDDIQKIENSTPPIDDAKMDLTYVRRKHKHKPGHSGNEPIRMTLIKSYCCAKLEKQCHDKTCVQEAHLYKNLDDAKDTNTNYMADWKIHVRVEAEDLRGVREKLKKVLTTLREKYVNTLLDPVVEKEKTDSELKNSEN